MARTKSIDSLLRHMLLYSLAFVAVGTFPLPGMQSEGKQASTPDVVAKINVENATRSIRVIGTTTKLLPESSAGKQRREMTLAIRNDNKSRITAILLELPGEGRGRRFHGKDYFMSRTNPAGLQAGEIDSIRFVIANAPSYRVRIAAALLAGEESDGEGSSIGRLRSGQRGRIQQTENAIAVFSECLSTRLSNPWESLQMIKSKISQLEEQPDSSDENFNNGAYFVKMSLLDWTEGAFNRAQDSADIAAALQARLVAMQKGIAAIK